MRVYEEEEVVMTTQTSGLYFLSGTKGTFHSRKEKKQKKENFDPVLIGV